MKSYLFLMPLMNQLPFTYLAFLIPYTPTNITQVLWQIISGPSSGSLEAQGWTRFLSCSPHGTNCPNKSDLPSLLTLQSTTASRGGIVLSNYKYISKYFCYLLICAIFLIWAQSVHLFHLTFEWHIAFATCASIMVVLKVLHCLSTYLDLCFGIWMIFVVFSFLSCFYCLCLYNALVTSSYFQCA